MKKLVISALFVSVFFIGVSSLITGVSAKLGSDDKAMELIRASRIAIGGNQNLTAVKSISIKANTTHFYEKNGLMDSKQGTVEYDIELPGRFSKRVMMGTPGAGDDMGVFEKEFEVIEGGGGSTDGKANVFIVRKSDGKNIEWTSADSDNVKVDSDKIIIKKDDGTVEEIKTDGKHKVIVRQNSDGKAVTVDKHGDDENTWVTDDGKRIRVEKNIESGGGHEGNEMLRMTIGLLMTAPEDGSVTYKFLGQGNVDGFPSNIIGVESNGSSFKLFLDAGSNLPQMISYEGGRPHMIFVRKGNETVEEKVVGPEHMKGSSERQIKFSDFRSVGSLLFPHRWTEVSNGKAVQNIDITGFEINPANIAERFEGGEGAGKRVIVRKHKN